MKRVAEGRRASGGRQADCAGGRARLGVVAGVGYLAARASKASVLRSVIYVAMVLVVVAGVLALKALVGH